MSALDGDIWDMVEPTSTLTDEVCAITKHTNELSADLTALAEWLLSLAPADLTAQLHFLYCQCRSLATATSTITLLDRLLADLKQAPLLLKQELADQEEDGLLLVELINWRLEQICQELPRLSHEDLAREQAPAVPLCTVRALLDQMGARMHPEPTVEAWPEQGDSRPAAPLLRLVEGAAHHVRELAALIIWLLPMVPEAELEEFGTMLAITRSYRLAIVAIQSLDALMKASWRSPRQVATGDLSIVLLLIDHRLALNGSEEAERQQLLYIREEIQRTQHLEYLAALRRHRRKQMAYAWEYPEGIEHGGDDEEEPCN